MNITILSSLYESLKISENRDKCPRPGIYKIIETCNGKCYDKPALMAKCHWRSTTSNDYDPAFIVEIQLETFKRTASTEQLQLINANGFVNMEIDVHEAIEDPVTKVLLLNWDIIDKPKIDFRALTMLAKEGKISINELCKFGDLEDPEEFEFY